ncbi:hypothetical protein BCR44DRAFT_1424392 [Catenaria anguillulae PL171]|uniref:Uncharacterized protein n=1 Tax=Catenaria anguillulae PL171 TaxID=765915 RepID=A0A1Y2I2M3_9FUNG|nr:hypothetical protein BCR44DRAFT_1424392 [Catenaria anguillulae PL171]
MIQACFLGRITLGDLKKTRRKQASLASSLLPASQAFEQAGAMQLFMVMSDHCPDPTITESTLSRTTTEQNLS